MSRLFEAVLVLGLHLAIFIIQSEAFNGKSTVRCNKAADIVFVLDSSTSIWKSDFEKQLNFVKYFVNNLNIGLEANQVRIGALSFSDKVEINFYLNESTDRSNILRKVSRIRQLTGSTYTWLALEKLVNMFKPGNGARPSVTHIAIILTDGNSQKPHNTLAAAIRVHRANIKVFALAIGEYIRVEEIRGIASFPKKTYFKHTASFSELEHIKESFFDRTCWEINTTPRPDRIVISTEAPSIPCKKPADIVFILDSSTSIARHDFKKQLNFVKYFVRNLNIGLSSKETRLGVLSFSDKVEINFNLNESTDKSTTLQKVSRIQQLSGSTYTWLALRKLVNMFKPGNGARSSVTQVAIILTDGNSQKPHETLKAANMIHRQTRIKVFALAIGENIAAYEIRGIASSPKDTYFKQTASYAALESIIERFFNTTCEEIYRTTTTEIYRTTTTAITPVICTEPADIVFVLDSSTSIRKTDFEKQLEFVKYFVRTLSVGQNGNQVGFAFHPFDNIITGVDVIDLPATLKLLALCQNLKPIFDVRIGVLSFSDKVEIDFNLNESTDKSSILQKVSRIRQLTGSTYTWLALRELVNMFKQRNGARPFVTHLAIILTDGNSQNPHATSAAAHVVHQANIKVFALAIGEYIKVKEIRDIASSPERIFFKKTASFSELKSIRESFLTTTCKVVNEIPPLPSFRISTTEGLNGRNPLPRVCDTTLPIEIVFLVNNVHFGQRRTEKILHAITHAERKIHHTCVSHFRTIFEDCSTFEDTFDIYNPRNRNHKFKNCRIGIFFVERGMDFGSPILQNITRNLLKDTTGIFAVMIGDIKEVSGLRYFIKDENIINVPHIEVLTSSLSHNVNRVICNNNNI